MVSIAALHVYPVKSCRGLAPDAVRLTPAGLEHDREWMVVAPDGRFMTQRELPRLARISTAFADGALVLAADGAGAIEVPLATGGAPVEVTCWSDRCAALDQGDPAARWLEAVLGRAVRLVRLDPAHQRRSDPQWTGGLDALTRFSDGYALLAISRASLADLNARLPAPLPMNRFRPNLELEGLPPYGEDALGDLVGGGVQLRRVKPCTRCIVTTTDQASGERDGDEPIRTLRGYRWDPALRGIAFGQNLVVVDGAGAWLRVGQELEAG